jgi:hypothetical protein
MIPQTAKAASPARTFQSARDSNKSCDDYYASTVPTTQQLKGAIFLFPLNLFMVFVPRHPGARYTPNFCGATRTNPDRVKIL